MAIIGWQWDNDANHVLYVWHMEAFIGLIIQIGMMMNWSHRKMFFKMMLCIHVHDIQFCPCMDLCS